MCVVCACTLLLLLLLLLLLSERASEGKSKNKCFVSCTYVLIQLCTYAFIHLS